jgi:hypothetical protein
VLSSRPVKCSPDALQASLIPRRSSPPPAAHPTFVAPIYQHKRTSTSYLSTSPTPSSALPYQADPAHRIFRRPIALLSYPPNPTHESTAPGRGLMPGGAGQLSSGGGQGRGVGVVTAEPSWLAERPRRRDPARSGRPAGGRRSRGCPDAGQAGRCLSVSSGPRWGCPSSRSSGHPASARPVSTRPVSSAIPGVRTDRAPVSAALPPRCPRRAGPWSGSVWRAAPAGRSGSTWRRGLRAAWSPAGIGPDGKGMVRRWPWLARTRVDPRPGPPLGRRSGCGAAWPPGRHGRWSRPGCRPGGGGAWGGAGAHRPRRASWAGRRRGARSWAWIKRW